MVPLRGRTLTCCQFRDRLGRMPVKPGLIGRVKHLWGEEDLRHASLQDFRDES